MERWQGRKNGVSEEVAQNAMHRSGRYLEGQWSDQLVRSADWITITVGACSSIMIIGIIMTMGGI